MGKRPGRKRKLDVDRYPNGRIKSEYVYGYSYKAMSIRPDAHLVPDKCRFTNMVVNGKHVRIFCAHEVIEP